MKYLITASLLNSWLYIWQSEKSVNVYDENIVPEVEALKRREEAYTSFIDTLLKNPIDNKFMKLGRDFEDKVVEFSRAIEKEYDIDVDNLSKEELTALEVAKKVVGGEFQLTASKDIQVDGVDYVLYGKLDALKNGKIIDIKRVAKYERPKYKWSSQHSVYLELVPEAEYFEYMISNGYNVYYERYFKEDSVDVKTLIHNFVAFLKANKLERAYHENWVSKY